MSVRPRMLAAVVLACLLVGASGATLLLRATRNEQRAGVSRVASARSVMLEQALELNALRNVLPSIAASRLAVGRRRIDDALARARTVTDDRAVKAADAREQRSVDLWFAAAALQIGGRADADGTS